MIFDPCEHEPLTERDWDKVVARSFVSRVVREADEAYDEERSWPVHPQDRYGTRDEALSGIYNGGAGTMWALTHLARTHGILLHNDYAAGIARCENSYRADPSETGTVVTSYFLGMTGTLMARYAITGDRSVLDPIETEMRSNVGNVAREALWGSPGTALAALLLRERDGDDRYDDVLHAVQDELWSTWDAANTSGALLWEQDLYGERRCFVGAAHGAIGNVAPLLRAADLRSPERRETLIKRVSAILEAYILRDGDAARVTDARCDVACSSRPSKLFKCLNA